MANEGAPKKRTKKASGQSRLCRLEFNSATCREISTAFDAAWDASFKKGRKRVPANLVAGERQVFISLLEAVAEAVPLYSALEQRKQKDRRRAVDKVASAVGKLLDSVGTLDADALAFLLFKVTTESHGSEIANAKSPFAYYSEGQRDIENVKDWLSSVHRGALSASRELPLISTSAALSAALAIERMFWERGFEYSLSTTGFAAQCLDAVLTAGGSDRTSLQYWLETAKSSEESMANFSARLRSD